jgi:hypothetical protein
MANMATKTILTAVAAAAAVLGLGSARADTVYYEDPATLHVSNGVNGGNPSGVGGDPNAFTGNTFDIYQNQGGAPNLNNPVLAIIVTPDTLSSSFFDNLNPLTGGWQAQLYAPGTPTGAQTGLSVGLGLNGTASTAFVTDWNSGTGDVYSVLAANGLAGANAATNSDNWTNLTGWEASANGLTVSGFNVYAVAFDSAALAGGDAINAIYGSLPVGTVILGYGTAGPDANGKISVYDTPWTQAGGITGSTPPSVPEPSGLALVFVGALGFLTRRRVVRRRP